jgi:hypothetical protein
MQNGDLFEQRFSGVFADCNTNDDNNNHDRKSFYEFTKPNINDECKKMDNTKETTSSVKKDQDYNQALIIFRYKFSQEFVDELYKFSKIHQYDARKDFKESWSIWVDENEELVNLEMRRLINLGYDGDILDKMFKSARYYFRKKSTEKKEPVQRRDYIGVSKKMLDSMDAHIKSNIDNEDYKPSNGFDDYCKKNEEILKEEVNLLVKNGFSDHIEIKNKIKKTYKNRYFIITK